MHLLTTYDQYVDAIDSTLDKVKPTSIRISTFGVYAGIDFTGRDITSMGKQYKSRVKDLMTKMQAAGKVKMLVGLSPPKSCQGFTKCKHCEKQYLRGLLRVLNHAEAFGSFQWRALDSFHMKLVMMSNKKEVVAVVGGRNLTDSNWIDTSFIISGADCASLAMQFELYWKTAGEINEKLISQKIREAGITKAGMAALMQGY